MTEGQIRRAPAPWTPEVWLLRVMILEPERICDPAEKAAWLENYYRSKGIQRGGKLETPAETAGRIESAQQRAGSAQGILAPSSISPLSSERRRKGGDSR